MKKKYYAANYANYLCMYTFIHVYIHNKESEMETESVRAQQQEFYSKQKWYQSRNENNKYAPSLRSLYAK